MNQTIKLALLPILICITGLQAMDQECMEPATKRRRVEPAAEVKAVAAETRDVSGKEAKASGEGKKQIETKKSLAEQGLEAFPKAIHSMIMGYTVSSFDFFEALSTKHTPYDLPPAAALEDIENTCYFQAFNTLVVSPTTLILELRPAEEYQGPDEYFDDDGNIVSERLQACCYPHVWRITKDNALKYRHSLKMKNIFPVIQISSQLIAGITKDNDNKHYIELWNAETNECLNKLELAIEDHFSEHQNNQPIYKLTNNRLLLHFSFDNYAQLIMLDIADIKQPKIINAAKIEGALEAHIQILTNDQIILYNSEGILRIYDMNFTQVAKIQHEGGFTALKQIDSHLFATAWLSNNIKIWNMNSWTEIDPLNLENTDDSDNGEPSMVSRIEKLSKKITFIFLQRKP